MKPIILINDPIEKQKQEQGPSIIEEKIKLNYNLAQNPIPLLYLRRGPNKSNMQHIIGLPPPKNNVRHIIGPNGAFVNGFTISKPIEIKDEISKVQKYQIESIKPRELQKQQNIIRNVNQLIIQQETDKKSQKIVISSQICEEQMKDEQRLKNQYQIDLHRPQEIQIQQKIKQNIIQQKLEEKVEIPTESLKQELVITSKLTKRRKLFTESKPIQNNEVENSIIQIYPIEQILQESIKIQPIKVEQLVQAPKVKKEQIQVHIQQEFHIFSEMNKKTHKRELALNLKDSDIQIYKKSFVQSKTVKIQLPEQTEVYERQIKKIDRRNLANDNTDGDQVFKKGFNSANTLTLLIRKDQLQEEEMPKEVIGNPENKNAENWISNEPFPAQEQKKQENVFDNLFSFNQNNANNNEKLDTNIAQDLLGGGQFLNFVNQQFIFKISPQDLKFQKTDPTKLKPVFNTFLKK